MNVQEIFDAFGNLVSIVALKDKIRNKQMSVRSVTKRECGNCEKWMKSTCIPEKRDKQFKSMSSRACPLFEIKPTFAELRDSRTEELRTLESELEEFIKEHGQGETIN